MLHAHAEQVVPVTRYDSVASQAPKATPQLSRHSPGSSGPRVADCRGCLDRLTQCLPQYVTTQTDVLRDIFSTTSISSACLQLIAYRPRCLHEVQHQDRHSSPFCLNSQAARLGRPVIACPKARRIIILCDEVLNSPPYGRTSHCHSSPSNNEQVTLTRSMSKA